MYNTKAFAAYYDDENIINKSSSGGMFTALSNSILNENGVIVCSIFNNDNRKLEYRIIKNFKDRDLARGSVYVESNINDSFMQALDWLENNPHKQMLFIGTGCLADAFKNLSNIKGFSDRVISVDLICHGVLSSKLLEEFLYYYLHIDHSKRLSQVSFRSKRGKNGWRNPEAFAIAEEDEYTLRRYMQLYYSGCAFRESCYHCPYTKVIRDTDITIGDYWVPDSDEFINEKGTSLVIVQSEKGMELFKKSAKNIIYKEVDIEKCIQPNLLRPTSEPSKKDKFWKIYIKKGIKYSIDHVIVGTVFHKAWRKIKEMLFFC